MKNADIVYGSAKANPDVVAALEAVAEKHTGTVYGLVGLNYQVPVDMVLLTAETILVAIIGERADDELLYSACATIEDILGQNYSIHPFFFGETAIKTEAPVLKDIVQLCNSLSSFVNKIAEKRPDRELRRMSRLLLSHDRANRTQKTSVPSDVTPRREKTQPPLDMPLLLEETSPAELPNNASRPSLVTRIQQLFQSEVDARRVERELLTCAFDKKAHRELRHVSYLPNLYRIYVNTSLFEQRFQGVTQQFSQQLARTLIEEVFGRNKRLNRERYALSGKPVIELHPSEDYTPYEVKIVYEFVEENQVATAPLPSSALPVEGMLIATNDGQKWLIEKEVVVLGRSADCDIHITIPAVQKAGLVSSKHAHIRFEDGVFKLYDGYNGKPSTNGTFANGARIGGSWGHTLSDGDEIVLASLERDRPTRHEKGCAILRFYTPTGSVGRPA